MIFWLKYDTSSIKIGIFVLPVLSGLSYRFQAIEIRKIRTDQIVPIVNSLKIVAKKIKSIEIWLCDKFYLADIHFVGSWEIKDSFSNGERQFQRCAQKKIRRSPSRVATHWRRRARSLRPNLRPRRSSVRKFTKNQIFFLI